MKCRSILALLAFVAPLSVSQANAAVRAPAQRLDALFVGSSTIEGWRTLERDFPEFTTVNLGRGGTTYADLERGYRFWLAPSLLGASLRPLVFLYSGDNDLAQGRAPIDILQDLRSIVRAIHRDRPDATVYVLTVKMSPARIALRARIQELNHLVRELSRQWGDFQVIDVQDVLSGVDHQPIARYFAADGLHLSPDGYAIWRNVLRDRLFGPEAVQ